MMSLIMMLSCSSGNDGDGNDDVNGGSAAVEFTSTVIESNDAPDWKIDLTMNDEAPTWVAPDASNFESSSAMLIKLPEELIPFSTEEDQMAVFVNDECRATSVRNVAALGATVKDVYFVLNMRGATYKELNSDYTLKYYSGGAHQIFTLTNLSGAFSSEYEKTDGEFTPELLLGEHKYPVHSLVYVRIPEKTPFTDIYPEYDLVGAFIDGECRGLCRPGEEMIVLSEKLAVDVELRYYNAQSSSIYIMKDKVKLRSSSMVMDFIF